MAMSNCARQHAAQCSSVGCVQLNVAVSGVGCGVWCCARAAAHVEAARVRVAGSVNLAIRLEPIQHFPEGLAVGAQQFPDALAEESRHSAIRWRRSLSRMIPAAAPISG